MPNTPQLDSIDRIEQRSTPAMTGSMWLVVGLLGAVEIISALWLSWLNPVQGYDENWYLINAHGLRGAAALPYAHHRPPMLSMIIALLGDYYRLASGLAHIAGTAAIFVLVRRLTSNATALAAVVVFMACGQLRVYNALMLTELWCVFFTLMTVYFFVDKRPFSLGVMATLLIMTHWSMVTVPPVVLMVYALGRRWHDCRRFAVGGALSAIPFLAVFHLLYGNPIAPLLGNISVQLSGPPTWLYYLRHMWDLPLVALAGGLAALIWVWVSGATGKRGVWFDVCLLLLGMIAARVVLLHLVEPRSFRFLVPIIPMLLLLTVLMIARQLAAYRRVTWVAWLALLISVLPGKKERYFIHDLWNDPTWQIVELTRDIEALPVGEMIYTDLNDLAVMGHSARLVVAVTGPDSWHHALLGRDTCTREEIPDGAAYLTRDPGTLPVIASAVSARGDRLSLVHWRTSMNLAASRQQHQ